MAKAPAPLQEAAAAPEKPGYHGHRQRLRDRLLAGGADALADYELLEFLLYSAQPRGDTKPLAKALLKRFGSLPGVLSADPAALTAVDGVGDASAASLLAVRSAALRFLRAEVRERPVMSSWQAVLDYLNAQAGFAEVEEFRLLFLDRKNALLQDEQQHRGTVDHTPVYPREVVKRALELGASAIIMVHVNASIRSSQKRLQNERFVRRARDTTVACWRFCWLLEEIGDQVCACVRSRHPLLRRSTVRKQTRCGPSECPTNGNSSWASRREQHDELRHSTSKLTFSRWNRAVARR